MAQAAELAICNGDSRGTFVAGDAELARRFIASAWPYLCLPEALWPGSAGPKLGLVCHVFWKWSHTCFQLEQPEFPEGEARGTSHCISVALARRHVVWVYDSDGKVLMLPECREEQAAP